MIINDWFDPPPTVDASTRDGERKVLTLPRRQIGTCASEAAS